MQSIHIVRDTLPRAWEAAVVECWNVGHDFPTQFDKDADPNSRDVAALIHVTDPMAEPRVHRSMPGGLDDLEKYRVEVCYGVHDHWIDLIDPSKWDYTYHERFRNYGPLFDGRPAVSNPSFIDQFEVVAQQLRECEYTRRAQMITWQPWHDPQSADPACLQRMWFRVQRKPCPACSGTGEVSHGLCSRCAGSGVIRALNMNIHIRSNDAYKAAFMNMYAFTEWQALMAQAISDPDGAGPVEVGEYIHVADSFHIYGSYFEQFRGFLRAIADRSEDERVYDTDFARPFFVDGLDALLTEDDMPQAKKDLVLARRAELVAEIG